MSERRYFGTYKGEIVEYAPSESDARYILNNGKEVKREKITPSPYPWQFHTREFWDAHPGMRWAVYSKIARRWFLGKEHFPLLHGDGFWQMGLDSSDLRREDFAPWQGDPADSRFENPFFRHYPAELDDPAWWRDNAPKWATCGSWDKNGLFFFYSNTPEKRAELWWDNNGILDRLPAMDNRYTGTWEDCPLIMRPAAKVPVVNYPKAAPKRTGELLSVHYVNSQGVVFDAKTGAARIWLNEQAPMFGVYRQPETSSDRPVLYTDTPRAAVRYLVNGFYNQRPDVIRKHCPSVTVAESGPRTEKRIIKKVAPVYANGDMAFCLGGLSRNLRLTRAAVRDLMQRFDVLSADDLAGKTITVRIDGGELLIVEE